MSENVGYIQSVNGGRTKLLQLCCNNSKLRPQPLNSVHASPIIAKVSKEKGSMSLAQQLWAETTERAQQSFLPPIFHLWVAVSAQLERILQTRWVSIVGQQAIGVGSATATNQRLAMALAFGELFPQKFDWLFQRGSTQFRYQAFEANVDRVCGACHNTRALGEALKGLIADHGGELMSFPDRPASSLTSLLDTMQTFKECLDGLQWAIADDKAAQWVRQYAENLGGVRRGGSSELDDLHKVTSNRVRLMMYLNDGSEVDERPVDVLGLLRLINWALNYETELYFISTTPFDKPLNEFSGQTFAAICNGWEPVEDVDKYPRHLQEVVLNLNVFFRRARRVLPLYVDGVITAARFYFNVAADAVSGLPSVSQQDLDFARFLRDLGSLSARG